jgi:hypothetical protein
MLGKEKTSEMENEKIETVKKNMFDKKWLLHVIE